MLAYFFLLTTVFFFFQAEDGIRDIGVTGVQTCALPISGGLHPDPSARRHAGRRQRRRRRQPRAPVLDRGQGGQLHAGGLPVRRGRAREQIGRASCRERVEISAVAVSLKKKYKMSSDAAT